MSKLQEGDKLNIIYQPSSRIESFESVDCTNCHISCGDLQDSCKVLILDKKSYIKTTIEKNLKKRFLQKLLEMERECDTNTRFVRINGVSIHCQNN